MSQMSESSFVHLHLHSEFSLRDGLVRLDALAAASAAMRMPAVAVTDLDNLFCAVKFYKAALKVGLKPIFGCDLAFTCPDDPGNSSRLLVLAMNQAGFVNLSQLITCAYRVQKPGEAVAVPREMVEAYADNLIAIASARESDIGRALMSGRAGDAERAVDSWLSPFGDRFYLEVCRTGRAGEEEHLFAACDLAAKKSLPVVATNDVRFLERDDFDAHEARVCIHQGRALGDSRRPQIYTEQQYLKSAAEMSSLFADLPGAIENTVEVAKRCNVELQLGKNFLPLYPTAEGKAVESVIKEDSELGLNQRLAQLGIVDRKPYDERLARELEVINSMGFAGYFLIVADFIKWAKAEQIPVGPGRGSGAGSLVAYALEITDLDPLSYDLLFERFLNPDRVSMPDFDIDFCMEGRDRVIDYVAQRYSPKTGADENGVQAADTGERVAQIITFGTMAAKAVVRDVGRVLGHPFGFVDQIAKLVPFEIGITLSQAMDKEPRLKQLYDSDEEVRALLDLALKLEGIARNAGKHAGGVVIAPSALTDFVPLYREPGTSFVTQFDMKDVESAGLVKFDFLGLRTLTIIDWAVEAIDKQRVSLGKAPLDIRKIPLEDPPSFDLIKAAATTAVFQLESRGMKDLIRRLQPDCFDDIIALVALFRPGPLQSGMVDDFIDRKHGRAEVEYPHPSLEPILKPTYGVILYQEQVMQIAQVLAGYSLGGADLLRRAMGKKMPEEMAKQRDGFVCGAQDRGVDPELAGYIFDLIEKFAGYGFNKSHSAAYALVAYQTAWLKAHFPAEFMAAVMTADMDNTEKVNNLYEECRSMELRVLPPSVNSSRAQFYAPDPRSIRFGLGAIKGVGSGAVETIVENREVNGGYEDLFDFCRRIDLKKANRRVIESLLRAGALDELGPSRASMMRALTMALQAAEQASRNAVAGQDDLFGSQQVEPQLPAQFDTVEEWPKMERLRGERDVMGLFMSGHPVDCFESVVSRITSNRIGELRPRGREKLRIVGLACGIRIRNTEKGRQAVVTLEDGTGRLDTFLGERSYETYRDLLQRDRILVAEGSVRARDDGSYSMSVSTLEDLMVARESQAKNIVLRMNRTRIDTKLISQLKETLAQHRAGPLPVCIDLEREGSHGRLRFGSTWTVRLSDELIDHLGKLVGNAAVEVEYR